MKGHQIRLQRDILRLKLPNLPLYLRSLIKCRSFEAPGPLCGGHEGGVPNQRTSGSLLSLRAARRYVLCARLICDERHLFWGLSFSVQGAPVLTGDTFGQGRGRGLCGPPLDPPLGAIAPIAPPFYSPLPCLDYLRMCCPGSVRLMCRHHFNFVLLTASLSCIPTLKAIP